MPISRIPPWFAFFALLHFASAMDLASPNGKLKAFVATDPSSRVVFSLTSQNAPIVLPPSLGILVSGQDLGAQATLGTVTKGAVYETYPITGNHAVALNRCRQASIRMTSGAAYRYRVPGPGKRTIGGKASTWTFPAGTTI